MSQAISESARRVKGLQSYGERKTWLHVKHGSICEESKHPREGFEEIEVNNPRTGDTVTKYVRRYKAVEAMVERVEWYDTENRYETRFTGFKLHLDMNGDAAVLDLPFDSQACNRFMKMAENIDFSAPVEFSAWMTADKKMAFAVRQNGENVRQAYTREEPGDCPEPEKTRRGGWNFDKMLDYLYDRMVQVVIPAVEAAQAARGGEKKEARQGGAVSATGAARAPRQQRDERDEGPEDPFDAAPPSRYAPPLDDDQDIPF